MKHLTKEILFALAEITGIGAVGYLASRAGVKAEHALNKAVDESETELTTKDKIKILCPIYAPTFLVGAATSAIAICNAVSGYKTEATLAAGAGMLKKSYDDYREATMELYGEEADRKIREYVNAKKAETQDIFITPATGLEKYSKSDDVCTFYDPISDRYFEATPIDVLLSEMHLNRMYALCGTVTVNQWYDFLGLEQFFGKKNDTPFNGDKIGWSVDSELFCIDFIHKPITLATGLEVIVITPDFNPDTIEKFT